MSRRSPFSAVEWAVIILFPISPIILGFLLIFLVLFPRFTAFVVGPILCAGSVLGFVRRLNRRDTRVNPYAGKPEGMSDSN